MSQTWVRPLLAGNTWREVPRRAVTLWRRSLQVRTVVMTFLLSGLAILVIGISISLSISANLFQSLLDRVLIDSNNATTAAQRILDSSDAADRAALQSLMGSTVSTVQVISGSNSIAYFRESSSVGPAIAPPDQVSPVLASVITGELRHRVQQSSGKQFWQSVSLTSVDGVTNPGVVVGSDIRVPGAGTYELYIGYNFAEGDQTLAFMQSTGVIGAVALLVLLTVIIFLVVRWVIEPVQRVAAISRQLAQGELGVRLPIKGDDELASLAASFNGMADSLQARIGELADLSIVQQRFVSDVSHELRTPLTTIRLASDVLYEQRRDFVGPTSRTVELLHTQTVRFESLLVDLLEISRYDAGSVQLERQSANIVRIVVDAIESVAGLAAGVGSEILLRAPGGWLDTDVDPRRIRRIVLNLLGNAIEHGEGHPIVVSVDSNEKCIALTVRDYGLGMSEEQMGRVFDRFWRADPSRTRTIGGAGLGLAISKEDALAHGGGLELWSELGVGTVFRLTLPRTADATPADSPLPLVPSDPEATGPGEIFGVDEVRRRKRAADA